MNTNPQTPKFGNSSEFAIEPDMATLLHMTNDVVSKIKKQTQEMYL